MKTKTITACLALIMMLAVAASCFAAFDMPASAAETYERCFQRMEIGELDTSIPVVSGVTYKHYLRMYTEVCYYLDLDFFVEQFAEELSTLKEYSLEMKFTTYDSKTKVDTTDTSRMEFYGMGTSATTGGVTSDYYDGTVTAKQNSYKTVLSHSNYKNSNPLPVMKTGDVVVRLECSDKSGYEYYLTLKLKGNRNGAKGTYDIEKELVVHFNQIETYTPMNYIGIYDFEYPTHGKTLDTEVNCDLGECVSVKYYDFYDLWNNNKYTEVTKAVAGQVVMAEFTIVKPHTDIQMYYSGIDRYVDTLKWDRATQVTAGSKPFNTMQYLRGQDDNVDPDAVACKFYASIVVWDNDDYVIKDGTIRITAPEDGATPSTKVGLRNVKIIGKRDPKPQFTVESISWFDSSLNSVDTFKAGKTYMAVLKLDPYGVYYFNEDSEKSISVPGASKISFDYFKAGEHSYITEDGWYLLAAFPKVTSKYYDITIFYDKPEVTVPQDSASYLGVNTTTDLSQATDVEVKWYRSQDITKDSVGEVCSSSDGDLKLQLDTSTVGTSYYKCFITCKVSGLESRIHYSSLEWVKVTVTEKASDPLTLSAVGKQSVSVTKEGQTVTFEVTAKNASGTVNYTWYVCDASGKSVDDVVIGTDKKLVVSGIDGSYGDIYYYKCVARDSKGSDQLIFAATVLYEKEISLPTTSEPDTSTPDTSTPDIVDPDTSKTDSAAPDTSKTDTSAPDTSAPDTSKTDSADPDASEPASSDPDTSKPEQSNQFGNNDTDGTMPVWLIIIIIVAILAVIAAVVIIIIKKKKANEVK